jgi:hypothetical protein
LWHVSPTSTMERCIHSVSCRSDDGRVLAHVLVRDGGAVRSGGWSVIGLVSKLIVIGLVWFQSA